MSRRSVRTVPIPPGPLPPAVSSGLGLSNPPPPPGSSAPVQNQRAARPVRVRKCKKGERYKVPGTEFDEDSDDEDEHAEWWYGVVTVVLKNTCKVLFKGDEVPTSYNAFLETWSQYRYPAADATAEEEGIYQAIEIAAKLRRPARAVVVRRAREQAVGGSSSSESDGEEEGKEDQQSQPEAEVEVEQWESDAEDDEHMDEPEGDSGDDACDDRDVELQMSSGVWTDVPRLDTDPRAANGSMPENITPAFLMPHYREEPLLSWFLFFVPLPLIAKIVKATNDGAMAIAWPVSEPWRHLRSGEFLRWLGLWILMTVYPLAGGGRRSYWRGMLNFGQYMPEKRFENVLRAFTLPQYKKTDPEWGGPGRQYYRTKQYDKFQEVRLFTDFMRRQFQKALKPGGWLCIDESMFSWLGRALKLPGWKIIKRKPHPIGLEAKTTGCAVTGLLIDFEFQEGTEPMAFFEYISSTNRSSGWLLRLTKFWHNTEQRTVIADAAFAQVRVAVALMRVGGLYLIGNVKGCTKYFCKAELRAECGEYERDRLVCLTKQMEVGRGADKVVVYGTGWRCTGEMVVTYVHTGGTNAVGSDRTKRKYVQMSTGKINTTTYHVKRPKVSSEYQHRMGAIDGHNYRRQSGKSTGSLEKVCVTRNTKDRIFISIISWVLINIFLLQKFFLWGGEEKKSPAELQEAIALALIENQLYTEGRREREQEGEADGDADLDQNDFHDCVKHPQYKTNTCKYCYSHKTVYYCVLCSNPQNRKLRKEKGPKGGNKYTQTGYMHFCKHGGCFAKHKCGEVPARRSKAQMAAAQQEAI